jgi:surfactin synthase thioesterase subunit
MQAELIDKSFVAWRAADPGARLVCVPHAGGGPSAFHAFARLLAPSLEPWVLRLPGHEGRIREPPIVIWHDLVNHLTDEIRHAAGLPCVLLGNCSGALLAFSCAHELAQRGQPPAALIICDHPTPDAVATASFGQLANAGSAELWGKIGALGGTPANVMQQAGLRDLLEVGLRGDCRALAGFRLPGESRPQQLDVPIAVIACSDSPSTSREQMLGWAGYTTSWFTQLVLPGDHWLLSNPAFPVAVSGICSFLLSTSSLRRAGGMDSSSSSESD